MSPTHSPKQAPWTPGPWTATLTIAEHDGLPACWQIDAEYHAVCTTQFCYAQETEANAHLIAAAPELYEALEAAAPMLETLHSLIPPSASRKVVWSIITQTRAALSKARPSNRGEA